MIHRFDPNAEFARLQSEFAKLFGECPEVPSGPRGERRRATWSPLIDVEETSEALVLRADLPGVKREDVHITLDGTTLTLSGERRFEQADRREQFVRVERTYGTFARTFALPAAVDAEKINAQLADGVLTLTLPKKTEPAPRRIAVS